MNLIYILQVFQLLNFVFSVGGDLIKFNYGDQEVIVNQLNDKQIKDFEMDNPLGQNPDLDQQIKLRIDELKNYSFGMENQ